MIEEKSTKDQIQRYINNYRKDIKPDFIGKLGCDNSNGMCNEYNSIKKEESKNIYQFLPIPFPKKDAEYVFICKEPSAGWAKDSGDAYEKANIKGYMNFISGLIKRNKKSGDIIKDKKGNSSLSGLHGIDIMILAFQKVFNNKSIYLTDMSKCAMNINEADRLKQKSKDEKFDLEHRYDCCSPYLKWELENIAIKDPIVFLVGKNYYFNYWNKKNKPQSECDITSEKRYFNEIVKYKTNKMFPIPHYAIQFSCPEYILSLLEDKSKTENANTFISEERVNLLKYYKENFILSEYVENDIEQSIQIVENSKNNIAVSSSHTLLFLIYENEFAKIKNINFIN